MTDQFKDSPYFSDLDKNTAPTNELVESVVNTYDFLVERYLKNEDFISNDLDDKIRISVNWHALVAAVGNARADMIRWGAFHLSEETDPKLDRHKYAGFLSKWIAKVRPINLEADLSVELPLALCRLNELFAFLVFRSYLNFDDGDNIILEKIEKELMYRFHFRDETGENLAFLAFCYEQAGNSHLG